MLRILVLNILLLRICFGFGQVRDVVLLDRFDDDEILPAYDGESVFNEVWGFVQDGNEYAVIGGTLGTYFFELMDGDQLRLFHFQAGKHVGTDAIHRDYHDYNGYLYEVGDEGSASLRIYDLHYLPDSVPIVYDDSSHIIRSHNIFIDTSSALLYSCGNTNQFGQDAMKVLSLTNPVDPTLVYDYNFVDYVHDVFVRNDTAYMNCGGQGLRIVNFTSPTMPIIIGSLEFYADKGYNHSGWLSDDGKTYVLCDETPAMRFKVCDVSDPSDIKVVALAKPDSFEETVPHNVMIKDGIAYFSYYNDGLQIYNIRNPENPKQIAYFDTYTEEDTGTNLYKGAWGVYSLLPSGRLLISDRKNGLFLLSYTPPPDFLVGEGSHGIYPNPADGIAYFYYKQRNNEAYTLEFYNMAGQKVKILEGINDHLYIDLSELTGGVYSYRYVNLVNKNSFLGKFVVTGKD